jgi:hypothetical protein
LIGVGILSLPLAFKVFTKKKKHCLLFLKLTYFSISILDG